MSWWVAGLIGALVGVQETTAGSGQDSPPDERVRPPEEARPAPVGSGIENLWRAPLGRPGRVTNPDGEDGNGMRLASGAEIALAELQGPGLVQHLWLSLDSADPHAGRSVVLRAFWDGEVDPSVEVPVGDFFGCGHGLERPLSSTAVQVASEGRARNCYWPMPFNRSARFSLRNDSAFVIRVLSYHVDWSAMDEPFPEPLRTFHASYRQQRVGPGAEEFVLAELEGPGHYVGTVLSFAADEAGWGGEGDDRFYFDGEEQPGLRGTGLDAYFGEAWTLREQCGPSAGVSLFEGTRAAARWTAYRWHLHDPLAFDRSLKVAFEARGWAERGGRWALVDDRRDHFSGVAFWYQEEPHAPFEALPASNDRLPFFEHRYELEALVHEVEVRESAAPAVRSGPFLAYGKSLRWTPQAAGAAIAIPFEIGAERDYDLVLRAVVGPGAGSFDARLDGRPLPGGLDLEATGSVLRERALGRHRLEQGRHVLELRPRAACPTVELDSLVVRW